MHKTLISATRVTALGLFLGLAMGCATRGQLDEIRATAENALSEARTASQTANDSMDEIRSARDASLQAQRAADNALACCNDNAEKIERMFERAMMK